MVLSLYCHGIVIVLSWYCHSIVIVLSSTIVIIKSMVIPNTIINSMILTQVECPICKAAEGRRWRWQHFATILHVELHG